MASYPSRKNEQFMFHFFKIILDDQGKLRLPPKFVRNYGHHLPSRVMLKVPSGAKWDVEIIRNDSQIWLQNGWSEFVEYYSISYGSFLVFEYDKNNGDFNVTIFDKTATEIDYPFSSGNGDHERANHEPDEAKDDDDVYVEILDHSRKTKVKPATSLLSRLNKKIKPETSKKALNPQCPTGNRKQSIEKKSRIMEQKLSFSNPSETAKKFSSSNPSFQAQIPPDCLKRRRLYVPKSFVKNMEQGTKAIILEVNNRLWPVKLLIYTYGVRTKGVLTAGWGAFARDNSLKVGDVCTFEIISNSYQTLQMKVSIRRDSGLCLPKVEETTIEVPDEVLGQFSYSRKRKEKSTLSFCQPHKKMKKVEDFTKNTWKEPKKENEGLVHQKQMVKRMKPYLTLKEKTMAVQTQGSTLQSENPTFQITVQPSHLNRSKPDIPAGFARKYIKSDNGVAVLNVLDGKTWTVNYCRKIISGVTKTRIMYSDWIKFVQGNDLQVGDTCTFELIDPGKSIFGVNISNLGKSRQSFSNPPGAAQKVNPVFQVVMTSSHLKGGSIVNVPHHFINNLDRVTRIAQLQFDNKLWTVKLLIYPHRAKSSFSSGWVSFARENSLKVGDICSFELIDTQNLLFKVSILRNITHV